LQGELRQLDARHVLEPGVGGPPSVPQLAGAAVDPAREFRTPGDAHIDERTQPDAAFCSSTSYWACATSGAKPQQANNSGLSEAAGHDGRRCKEAQWYVAPHTLPLPKDTPNKVLGRRDSLRGLERYNDHCAQ
jgi:hypothetical protein